MVAQGGQCGATGIGAQLALAGARQARADEAADGAAPTIATFMGVSIASKAGYFAMLLM